MTTPAHQSANDLAEHIVRTLCGTADISAPDPAMVATVARVIAPTLDALASFKSFHRRLCERFGYGHDETDWRRDLASLEEHIAQQLAKPEADCAALRLAVESAKHALERSADWEGTRGSLALIASTLTPSPGKPLLDELARLRAENERLREALEKIELACVGADKLAVLTDAEFMRHLLHGMKSRATAALATDADRAIAEELARLRAREEHFKLLNITLLDAKWLDPECHQGCKSLVWKQRAESAESALRSARAALEPFAALDQVPAIRECVQDDEPFMSATHELTGARQTVLTVGDIKRAAATLAALRTATDGEK